MPILLADGAPDSYRLGDVLLDALYVGDDRLWPLAQGMTKVGTQQIGANSYAKVVGWTPEAGSTVVGDALVVPAALACTVSASVTWTNNGANRLCRVTRNGAVVWTSPVGTVTVAGGSFPLTVAAGDVLALEALTTSSLATNRVISAAGTFLRLTPA